jgi:chromosome segregation ATPase
MSIGRKDKTFGFKVTDEDFMQLEELFKESGFSSKDEWMKNLIKEETLESVKEANHEFKQPLTELQVHTSRMYELVVNMVNQSVYLRDHAVKEVSDKLGQKESIIGEYQEKTKTAIEELKQVRESMKELEQGKEELAEQLEGLRSMNVNNQDLIQEYKEKIDTLSSLVNQYKGYADENEKLKAQFAHEREQLQSQVKEISGQNHDQQDEMKELKQEVQSLKEHHAIELERLNEKKDFEKDKSLLELEREYQQKLLSANEEYTARFKELYEEMNALRKENEEVRKGYEQKIGQLQQEQTKKQAPPKSNNQNKG